MEKGLYIKTYGCQTNVYDSTKMAELLNPHGFKVVESPLNAHVIILNTCNIREKAAEKLYSELGRIKKIKNKRKEDGLDTTIVVAGCVAQAEGEQVVKRAPIVDVIVGPQSYHNIPTLLEEVKRKNKWVMDLDFEDNAKFDSIENNMKKINDDKNINNVMDIKYPVSSFLAIQEGCDKFCHFCVVPYTRGAEYSRSVEKIYREAMNLVENGVKEITLLGQNVNAYHGVDYDQNPVALSKLINVLSKINGLERIRYTTSHPRDMVDEKLFEIHADNKKVMPFIHLPIQSGSNEILKAMNRKHTVEFYMKIIDSFTKYNSNIKFSSDFIVGYPGETDKDFNDTLALIMAVNYIQAYSFKYSKRPGTPASILENQIPDDVKNQRLQQLQLLLQKQQMNYNKQCVGGVVPTLIDKLGKNKNQLLGKSEYMQSVAVNVDEDHNMDEYMHKYMNQIVNVKIDSAGQNSVSGIILE